MYLFAIDEGGRQGLYFLGLCFGGYYGGIFFDCGEGLLGGLRVICLKEIICN